MIELKIFQKPYKIPSNWKECSIEQIRRILPTVLGENPLPAQRMYVLQELISPALSKKKLRKLTDFERFELLELVRWCWNTPMDACPIEYFSFEGKDYYLPLKDFSHMSAIEFAMGHLHMQIFLRGKYTHLDKLVSTICRPLDPGKNIMSPDFDGERREKYSTPAADVRAARFEKLDITYKIMVLQYFINLEKYIFKQYDVFDKSSTKEEQPKGDSAVLWVKMLFDIAETGVFGDIDKVYHTDIHTILFYLQKKKQERLAS
ncbi:hypothetical protein [Xanthocytophaga flava]|uniref:hypothetical protein n=1 Tax=Xanthocytophaga flava TaxID=3048013 RepID=UPI0028D24D6A|nr:hypothetical protein [Xanthocytophaga flavus]MDJ1468156.1 hypothetical protein [Xanthocytophaga flavus]